MNVSQLDILAEKLLQQYQKFGGLYSVPSYTNPYTTCPTNTTLCQIVSTILNKF